MKWFLLNISCYSLTPAYSLSLPWWIYKDRKFQITFPNLSTDQILKWPIAQ